MLYTVAAGWGWRGVGDYNSPTPGLISLCSHSLQPLPHRLTCGERMELKAENADDRGKAAHVSTHLTPLGIQGGY